MNRISIILALLLVSVQLTGCAKWVTRGETPATGSASGQTQPEQAIANLPELPLTPDLLYDLLVGEIAGQRGKLTLSVDFYARAAHTTRDPRIAERATRIAIYARRHDVALTTARLWVDTDTENLKARQILASLYIRNHQPEAALVHLEKLLAGPGIDVAKQLLLISNQLSGEQDKQAALGVMHSLLQTHKNNPDAQYAYANLAVHAGETNEAMQAIDAALSQRPDWPMAIIMRARILTREGNLPAALKYLETAVNNAADTTVLRLAYARLLVDSQRLDDAWQQFSVLHEQASSNKDILYAFAVLSMQTKRLDAAEQQFKKLAAFSERRNEAYFYLGQIAELRKNKSGAMEYYSSISSGQHYLDAQVRIAYLLADLKGVEAARQHIETIETSRPAERVRLYIAEGDMLTEAKQYPQALKLYNEALKTSPDNTDLLYARAMLGEKMGDIKRLEIDLRRIIKSNPNNAQALNALGYTLADRTQRHEEALGYIKQAMALEPRSFYILDSLGWVLYRMGRYDEAVKYLRQAIELNWDPEIAAHLGEVLWVKGEQESAREIWDTALKKSPGDKILLDVIKRFEQ